MIYLYINLDKVCLNLVIICYIIFRSFWNSLSSLVFRFQNSWRWWRTCSKRTCGHSSSSPPPLDCRSSTLPSSLHPPLSRTGSPPKPTLPGIPSQPSPRPSGLFIRPGFSAQTQTPSTNLQGAPAGGLAYDWQRPFRRCGATGSPASPLQLLWSIDLVWKVLQLLPAG